jgi:hypothetical protein
MLMGNMHKLSLEKIANFGNIARSARCAWERADEES